MKPIVAIVGRPNVGKSTFFNAIVGRHKALVEDFPGVTRDRNYADVNHMGKDFILVDTGGFFVRAEEPILKEIKKQVDIALQEADMVIAVFDGKEGKNPLDAELTDYLRKLKKPVFYVVNKIDHQSHEGRLSDFYSLGAENLYAVSAEHGLGVMEVMDAIAERIPAPAEQVTEEKKYHARVAILGKPNVGKSSLLNALLGYERAIVSEVPGTTRDAIDTEVIYNNKKYLFIDTAGIRRKARISLKLEKFSVMEALRALERVDVALLVIDAYEGVSEQEQKIAQLIKERGRGCVIIFNKWDKVQKDEKSEPFYQKMIQLHLPFVDYAQTLFVSATTGKNVTTLFRFLDIAAKNLTSRISTGVLNRIIKELQEKHPLPIFRGKRIKIYYCTQQGVDPPFFLLFTNYPEAVPGSAVKFIERMLREHGSFAGVPIRIAVRKKR